MHAGQALKSLTSLAVVWSPYLVATDALACLTSFAVIGRWDWTQVPMLLVTLGCLSILGLYRSRLSLSLLDDVPFLVGSATAGVTMWLAVHDILGVHDSVKDVVRLALISVMSLMLFRGLSYALVRWARRAGYLRHAVLIVGAGHVGIRLTLNLQQHREYALDPVGFIDEVPRVEDPAHLPVPLLGRQQELAEIIANWNVGHVIVAFGTTPESELVDILRTCDRMDCEIFLVPRLFELHNTTRNMDQVWGLPLVRVRRAPYRTFAWKLKRLEDIVVSAVALLLLSPLALACAIAVRLEGGANVIFRQERVGLDGRPFHILKFRSLRPIDDGGQPVTWNISTNVGLGPVGRFLRATSFDELPQLWNILWGHMSLVGPRPERQHFVAEFARRIPRYTARSRVPAGLTGWAQVHGLRGDTSIEDRASFDNYYIENWSLWCDAKIMLLTVRQVMRRGGG